IAPRQPAILRFGAAARPGVAVHLAADNDGEIGFGPAAEVLRRRHVGLFLAVLALGLVGMTVKRYRSQDDIAADQSDQDSADDSQEARIEPARLASRKRGSRIDLLICHDGRPYS